METAKLTVRMSKELLERLKDVARVNRRSVNQQIIWYVMQALDSSVMQDDGDSHGGDG